VRLQLTDKPGISYLEENLTTFAGLLRSEGLPVGTAEMIDALKALEKVDLSSRPQFKAALQATMVKSRRDQALFAKIFDRFFLTPEEHHLCEEERCRQEFELEQRLAEANQDLQFKGEALQLSPEELQQYSSLSAEQRNQLKDFMQKTEKGKNVGPHFKPILETIVKSHLRYRRDRDEQKRYKTEGSGDADGAGSGGGIEDYLRERDIAAIAASDLPAAEQLLQRLSRKLAIKILRRRRSGPRSGPLDFRRSIRDNMQYGGLIFKIRRRPKRRSRQQILLLCDVSASMKSYSTFVLHFLYGLHEAVRDLSCFSFSDNLESLDGEIKGKVALKLLLDRVIRRSKNWGGGTDIGRALGRLISDYPDRVNLKTTLIVVSDTKTVALDQSIKELKKIKERVRRVIWLNPLPLDRWADYRSVALVSELVEMWPCSTIAQLEEVLAGRL
jgi:uncharacterized protein